MVGVGGVGFFGGGGCVAGGRVGGSVGRCVCLVLRRGSLGGLGRVLVFMWCAPRSLLRRFLPSLSRVVVLAGCVAAMRGRCCAFCGWVGYRYGTGSFVRLWPCFEGAVRGVPIFG